MVIFAISGSTYQVHTHTQWMDEQGKGYVLIKNFMTSGLSEGQYVLKMVRVGERPEVMVLSVGQHALFCMSK